MIIKISKRKKSDENFRDVCVMMCLSSLFFLCTQKIIIFSKNATKGTKNDTITMQNDSNHDLLKKIKNFINIMMNTKNI